MKIRSRSFRLQMLPAAILFVLMLGSLVLMSDATQDSIQFNRLYSTLLAINVVILVLMLSMILINMVSLWRQFRRRVTGSRLAVRLVVLFVCLALAPVSAVYYFSVQFIGKGIDSWFDVQIEQAFNDALDLSRSALDLRMREHKKETEELAMRLMGVPRSMALLTLGEMRRETEAVELTLMTASGQFVASDSVDTSAIIPDRPDDSVILGLRQGHSYIGLDPIGERGLHVRVVVPVPGSGPVAEEYILQGLYPLESRMNDLAERVQSAFARYQEMTFLRKPLRNSFMLTLSLVLLMTLLAAIWAAFLWARRLVAPIIALASGTQAVARGNYNKRISLPDSRDEMSSLVKSFNEMTRKIAFARDAADHSQLQAESERAYLQGVLEGLSSGVITLDRFQVIRTANPSAAVILGVDPRSLPGQRLDTVAQRYPHLEGAAHLLQSHFEVGGEWRQEITIFGPGGRQVVMFRGKGLTGVTGEQAGFVVVFDDITTLIQVERDAAWGEVARRMAHEIKNPLTPIQLSAERLRHKYLPVLEGESGELLDRATHTIVQQVQAMKEMVKMFSEYARMPKMQLSPLDLNSLILEVMDLYQDNESSTRFDLRLDKDLPTIAADADRLRQLMHNLVRNAIDATQSTPLSEVTISTRFLQDAVHSYIELRVDDTGSGIPEDIVQNLFEPYVTTKPKGTGLGLAIVKKIVEEHSGMVWAENRTEQQGASVIIRLPVPGAGDQDIPVLSVNQGER